VPWRGGLFEGLEGNRTNGKWFPMVGLLAPPLRGFVIHHGPKPHAKARG
jgi:hypothetical protein